VSIEDRLKEVFKKVIDIKPEEIKPDQQLDGSLGIDSTEMVEIVVALKKEFAVPISDNEIKKTFTFNKIVEVLKTKGVQ
jgi:acyl carrier protein